MSVRRLGISGVSVSAFKSIFKSQRIDIKPLTLLAGANSSGKSSMMQPLLLLKQTLEASNDPGALLLDGPCVRFTSADQLLSRKKGVSCGESFSVRIELKNGDSLETWYVVKPGQGFDISRMIHISNSKKSELSTRMGSSEIYKLLPGDFRAFMTYRKNKFQKNFQPHIYRNRCFLELGIKTEDSFTNKIWKSLPGLSYSEDYISAVQGIIHLPGLRGNPRRTYPKSAVSSTYPGTFDNYVASIISHWQVSNKDKLHQLTVLLKNTGLSWKVAAKSIDDTQVELRVGRLAHGSRGGAHDLVSIADVGVGVSQVLPVLVALVAVEPGQLVYIEQPEIHLHPKAQRCIARALCEAAKGGVCVVVETHSAIILREVQTLVAKGDISVEDVGMHWFQRDLEGETVVRTAELDRNGSYGEWPEDFGSTELEVERDYLDAVEMRGGE